MMWWSICRAICRRSTPARFAPWSAALDDSGADIATLAAEITDPAERDNPAVVKAVVAWEPDGQTGPGALFHPRHRAHPATARCFIMSGIYAYRRAALARFVALPPSPLEKREKLEQLRALEAGMSIAVARVDSVPLSRRYSGRSRQSQPVLCTESVVMIRSILHAKRIAFQGEPGAYANLAAREAVPHATGDPQAELRGRDRRGEGRR